MWAIVNELMCGLSLRAVSLQRFADRPFGRLSSFPAAGLRALARLELLVDVKEVLDLVEQVRLQVAHVLEVRPPRIGGRDGENLRVRSLLVGHPEHRDRTRVHAA